MNSYRPAPSPPPEAIRFFLIPVLGDVIEHHAEQWRTERMYGWLKQHIADFFDEPFEHVFVLFGGERRDMFVGETSAINGRHIRNIRATEIYRAAAIENYRRGNSFDLPKEMETWQLLDPERFPAISGPAVLFPDHSVWR